ncbi:hypothetical protein [Streptomyces sp. x-19]|uniref:hypothetical protein n=1 Tax=Streptomyces sp. x-19 TaxID=2789280 RepID=UPI00397F3DB2
MSASILSRTALRRMAVTVAGVTAASIFATTATAHAAEAQSHQAPRPAAAADVADDIPFDDASIDAFANILRIIDEIPESVLAQGQEATVKWLEEHAGIKAVEATGPVLYAFNLAGCSRGILLAVGSNIFAIAKVYKVKKAIDKLGGINKVITKIRSKKKAGKTFKKGIMEVFEEAGGGLGGIAAEILGIDGVVKNCW